jgi:hypothetical protein
MLLSRMNKQHILKLLMMVFSHNVETIKNGANFIDNSEIIEDGSACCSNFQ